MELYPLKVFLAVANEKSFSRAAEKMLRTQPAISLAVQRLEADIGEKLIDRSSTPPILTDAGRIVPNTPAASRTSKEKCKTRWRSCATTPPAD